MTGKTSIEPGFCVVQRPGSLTEQAMWLYGTRNMPAANYFLQLNADVAWAKPGQILIVADPEGNNHPAAMSALATAKRQPTIVLHIYPWMRLTFSTGIMLRSLLLPIIWIKLRV